MFEEDLTGSYRDTVHTEETQLRALRLHALCRVYEQADRVLSGDPVLVHVMPDGPAPAWSDGAAIYLNAQEIDSIDLETLTQINGLNYHELSHHLYTPRKGTTIAQWVLENDYMQSFNMLEDQRIETLFIGRYPSVAPYLVATVSRWLAGTPEEAMGNYICVRGRRYLPVAIRQGFRDMFAFPELIPAIVDIVDKYRLLAFPKDYEQAKVLIRRYQDEVLSVMDLPRDASGGPNGCGHRVPVAKGRPEPGKAQERDAARAKHMGDKESTYVPKPKQSKEEKGYNPSGCGPDTNKPPEEKEGKPHGEGDKPGEAYVPLTIAEALDIREQAIYSTVKDDHGTGHVPSVGGIPEYLSDLLADAIEEVLSRKDVIQDVKVKQKVIIGGDGKHEDVTKPGKFDDTSVPPEAIIAFRKFATELKRLREDSDPAWERETPTGKINIQRVIRGTEFDKSYDRWDEGNDGADVEAVILVDRSGSMSSGQNDRIASIACWIIKRALEEIDAPVTVYAFDDKAEMAYKRTEKAQRTKYKFIYGNGGTQPYPTLLAAEQLLMSSRKKNKMLFIVTDGVFDNERNDDVISRISKRGILTAMTLIMSDRDNLYYANNANMQEGNLRHKAEVYARIGSSKDLLPFAKSVVISAIRKRARGC